MKNNTYKALSIVACVVFTLSACSSNDDDNGAEVDSGFDFQSADVSSYTRIDRMGMPAIATALISSKDAYNDANPTDDAAGNFVPEILASLQTLHGALDDQLTQLGLTPCTVVGDGTGTCAQFAVPLILPDTIKINTAAAAGFPNGRTLTDPVIDVTLAVALLELTGEPAPHAPDALVGVLNPAENDKAFSDSFPYLATPH
jgi:hypothetical protein